MFLPFFFAHVVKTVSKTFPTLALEIALLADPTRGMTLAREANKYLDDQAPWFEVRTDVKEAAKRLTQSCE